MTRSLRTLLLSSATLLVVALVAFGWSRFDDSPSSAASDADDGLTGPEVASNPNPVEVEPIDPIDPRTLDISLQIDRTRAPLAQVADQFRTRVAAAPGDHISLTLLGSVLLSQAREEADLDLYAEAETIAEQALELAPTSTDARLLLVNALAARHEFAAVLDATAEILEREPDNVGALTAHGDAQLSLGETDAAEATFTTIASLGRDAGIVSRLSRTAYLEGDTARAANLAVESLRLAQGIPLRPSDAAFYWFQLGFVLFEGGDVDGAASALELAVAIAPEHPGANELLGRVRAGQGRFAEAITVYEGLLARGPAADLHGELAGLLRLGGDDAAADAQIRLGLDLAAETMDSYPAERRHLASFLVDHDPEAAVRLAETDFAERKDAGAYEMLGWALHTAGRSAEGAPLLEHAVATGPVSAEVLHRAGVVAAAVGDDERAVALLDAALTLNPSFDPTDAPAARELLDQLRS